MKVFDAAPQSWFLLELVAAAVEPWRMRPSQ